MMTPDQLRRSYVDFMKRRGASLVPSASLLPENDPSTLFTGSGMQPMVPYLLGEKHPIGNEITDIQKCLRTVDIEEVGDMSHLTFFEMTGRWEFRADEKTYKKKQIDAIWDWQVNELGINPEPRPVTVIETTVAVFVVAHQRIPDGGKMRPNLVGLSRNQMDFQKRQLLIPCQRKILRLNGGSIPLKVRLMRNDLYQVLPAVLFQKSLNPLPFCDPPFHGA